MQRLHAVALAAVICLSCIDARSLKLTVPGLEEPKPGVRRSGFEFDSSPLRSSRDQLDDTAARFDETSKGSSAASEIGGDEARGRALEVVEAPRHVDGRELLQMAGSDNSAGSQNIKLMVFVVDMCGKAGGPATTAAAVQSLLAGGPDRSVRNLADYMSTCSNNVMTLDVGALTVLDVQMPCNGVSTLNNPWTVNSCQGSDMMGWMDYAEQQALRQGHDFSAYTYRIMVLPNNPQQFMGPYCTWAGLGTTGLLRNPTPVHGYVWLSGAAWNMLPAYLHELGHTFGFMHAAATGPAGCGACDGSSTMGFYGMRCYNAPQNWALGWSQELDPSLSFLNMPGGQTIIYDVAVQGTSRQSVLRVQAASNNSDVFISLRKNAGLYDTPFPSRRDVPTLLVHTWNQKAFADFTQAGPTYLQASLPVVAPYDRLLWTDAATGLTVRVAGLSSSGTSASIALCKPSERNEERSCHNGLDDDCDGLTDDNDPDCMD